MKHILVYTVLALAAVAFVAPPLRADEEVYSTLLAQLKQGNSHINYDKLRRAYVDSSGYDPRGLKIAKLLQDMLRHPNCTDSLDKALDIQEISYVNIDAHLMAAFCYSKTHQPVLQKFQQEVADGLIQSVLNSGDGTSIQTAFYVVTSMEELGLLRGRRLRFSKRMPVVYGGHDYDRIEATEVADGKPRVVFFNVDLIHTAEKRDFENDSHKPDSAKAMGAQ